MIADPSILVEVTPVGGGAYSSGDVVGGLITLPGAGRLGGPSGLIGTVTLIEATAGAAAQAALTSIFFFDRVITVQANNATFIPGVSDMSCCLGSVEITATSDWSLFSTSNGAVASKTPGIQFTLARPPAQETGALYAVWVTKGTPTYPAGPNKLYIRVSILPTRA